MVFFSQCISIFSLSLCNMGCHNDLKNFLWKKNQLKREQAATKRKKIMNKSQTIYNSLGGTVLLFWQPELEHPYPTILILKPNSIIPKCSFLLWNYIVLLVNLSHLIIEKLIAILFLQSKKHYLIWNAGVEVRCLMGADMFIPREMCTVCGLPLDCELFQASNHSIIIFASQEASTKLGT